ncbi:DUF3093 domain-containing protein [Kutzneria sp. 744]|uniref:DUF3093 domain-containing protein n=1 Tax=Kutzneria sp. (strain 744) TaxID=345341 RepID=UPI0003EEAC61|nr:hypothetical protein KUTG_07145 [Kutzneria sp. 744]
MTESVSAVAKAEAKSKPVFFERLHVSWWGWPLPVVAAVLMAAEVHMGYPGVRAWLPYLITIPLVIGVMLWLGRATVKVVDGELWVGDAHVPLRLIDEVEVIPAKAKRKALGPDLDPAAFVSHRGWVGPVLRVYLNDPSDPTPYWLFSVRNADKLAALLTHN